MKDFLLLFRDDTQEGKQLSPEQIEAHMKRWQEWIRGLVSNERFVGGQPLMAGGKVLSGPSKKLSDGPFMEGKEVIGGYIHVKAADIDEATEIAGNCPILEAQSGTVEIREISPDSPH